MTQRRKRVGLNPTQLKVMETMRNLEEAEAARLTRIVKGVFGIKPCYPTSDASLDAELFLPASVVLKAGFSGTTVDRYTEYFIGIARRRDEPVGDWKHRRMTLDHPGAPLLADGKGKTLPRWKGVFKKSQVLPHRLVSERLLLFIVMGVALVKGDQTYKDKKYEARRKIAAALKIRPATVVAIGPDDEIAFYNSISTVLPIRNPLRDNIMPMAKVPVNVPSGIGQSTVLFGGSPIGESPMPMPMPIVPPSSGTEDIPGIEEMLSGITSLKTGISKVIAHVQGLSTGAEGDIAQREIEVVEAAKMVADKQAQLDAREAVLDERERLLAEVLRVAQALGSAARSIPTG